MKLTWPVGITVFFAIAISGAITFVTFSLSHRMDLVEEAYYEKDIHYEKHADKLRRTQLLGDQMDLKVSEGGRFFEILLPKAMAVSNGIVRFYRPSDAALDSTVDLRLNSENRQLIDLTSLKSGFWKVQVEWRYDDQDYYAERSFTKLAREDS